MGKYVRREDVCCKILSDYLIKNKIPFMRIASEIPTKRMGVINRLKREGFQPGYPDYFIYLPYYEDGHMKFPGLAIEMKWLKGHLPTMQGKDPQHGFLLSLASQGFITYAIRGEDIAILCVERYLRGEFGSLYEDKIQRNGRIKVLARCYNELV